MTYSVTLQKARMEKTIDMVRTNFNSVRTGRSNPAMLDKIEVRLKIQVPFMNFLMSLNINLCS